jgi:peptidyl-prolyl cis-trans isomerase-like 3
MSVTLHTTLGDLKLELACAQTPRLASNFLAHCGAGTYVGTSFHRLIAGFLCQAGDPTGRGRGGEAAGGGPPLEDEFVETLRHAARGVLSMANNGPHTNKSQFFITFAPQPSLDDVYSVIGRLIGGGAVLDAIEAAPVGAKHRPVTDIVITRVTVHANPFAQA